jgi:hypothetical protein
MLNSHIVHLVAMNFILSIDVITVDCAARSFATDAATNGLWFRPPP